MEGSRRLAAVMFTDMVGYTALAQADESTALGLVAEQRDVARPLFATYHGREVKSTGDGLLVEFGSARDAVQCAFDLQQRLHERNARPNVPPLHLRIGVHVGDVEHRGDDIFGDAVNVAARIESVAEGGGVCVSGQVRDQVINKVAVQFEKIEPLPLKGIQQPIEIYRAVLPWRVNPAEPGPAGPPRLAVLPFTNISPDANDAYIADGMTEELIATMSKIRGLSVLARTSVMRYRGTQRGVEEIGRELKVGTILEGSVRKSGPRIRITVQLIDTQSGVHLWSDSYDRGMDDIFFVQSEISQTVAKSLRVRLLDDDRARVSSVPTTSSEAHAWYLKGLSYSLSAYDSEPAVLNSIRCFERAIRLDSQYALAYAMLADSYVGLAAFSFWPSEKAFPAAEKALTKAFEIAPDLAEAYRTSGLLRYFQGDLEAAAAQCRRAIELNSNDAFSHAYLAWSLQGLGDPEEALTEARLSVQLAPLDRFTNQTLGHVLLGLRRFDECVAHLLKVNELDPGFGPHRTTLGVSYMGLGQYDKAVSVFEPLVETNRTDLYLSNLGWAYARAGRTEEARRILEELKSASDKREVRPSLLAAIHIALGEREAALALFEEAYAKNDVRTMNALRSEIDFDDVRSDPRFQSLLAREKSSEANSR